MTEYGFNVCSLSATSDFLKVFNGLHEKEKKKGVCENEGALKCRLIMVES